MFLARVASVNVTWTLTLWAPGVAGISARNGARPRLTIGLPSRLKLARAIRLPRTVATNPSVQDERAVRVIVAWPLRVALARARARALARALTCAGVLADGDPTPG